MDETFSQGSFICDNINDLNIEYRKDILQMIYNSPFKNKIKEKGGGTQVKIEDISNTLINKIYMFIVQKINEQKLII